MEPRSPDSQPSIAQTRHVLPLQGSSSILLAALPGVGAGPRSSAPSTVPSLPWSPLPSCQQHRGNGDSIYFAYCCGEARLCSPGLWKSPGARQVGALAGAGRSVLPPARLPAVISPGVPKPRLSVSWRVGLLRGSARRQGWGSCPQDKPQPRSGRRGEWGLQVRSRGWPG